MVFQTFILSICILLSKAVFAKELLFQTHENVPKTSISYVHLFKPTYSKEVFEQTALRGASYLVSIPHRPHLHFGFSFELTHGPKTSYESEGLIQNRLLYLSTNFVTTVVYTLPFWNDLLAWRSNLISGIATTPYGEASPIVSDVNKTTGKGIGLNLELTSGFELFFSRFFALSIQTGGKYMVMNHGIASDTKDSLYHLYGLSLQIGVSTTLF